MAQPPAEAGVNCTLSLLVFHTAAPEQTKKRTLADPSCFSQRRLFNVLQQHVAKCGAPNLLHAWRHEVPCPVPGIQGRCHSRLQPIRDLHITASVGTANTMSRRGAAGSQAATADG